MLIALPLLAAHHLGKRAVLNSILYCLQMLGMQLGKWSALNFAMTCAATDMLITKLRRPPN